MSCNPRKQWQEEDGVDAVAKLPGLKGCTCDWALAYEHWGGAQGHCQHKVLCADSRSTVHRVLVTCQTECASVGTSFTCFPSLVGCPGSTLAIALSVAASLSSCQLPAYRPHWRRSHGEGTLHCKSCIGGLRSVFIYGCTYTEERNAGTRWGGGGGAG